MYVGFFYFERLRKCKRGQPFSKNVFYQIYSAIQFCGQQTNWNLLQHIFLLNKALYLLVVGSAVDVEKNNKRIIIRNWKLTYAQCNFNATLFNSTFIDKIVL